MRPYGLIDLALIPIIIAVFVCIGVWFESKHSGPEGKVFGFILGFLISFGCVPMVWEIAIYISARSGFLTDYIPERVSIKDPIMNHSGTMTCPGGYEFKHGRQGIYCSRSIPWLDGKGK